MDHGDWVSGWVSPRKAAHWPRPSLCFPPGFPFQLVLPRPPSPPGSSSRSVCSELQPGGPGHHKLLLSSPAPGSAGFAPPSSHRQTPGCTEKVAYMPPLETELLGSLKASFMPSSHLCQCLCPGFVGSQICKQPSQSLPGRQALPPSLPHPVPPSLTLGAHAPHLILTFLSPDTSRARSLTS